MGQESKYSDDQVKEASNNKGYEEENNVSKHNINTALQKQVSSLKNQITRTEKQC